jgi:D-xylose transport system substrate-binding protein
MRSDVADGGRRALPNLDVDRNASVKRTDWRKEEGVLGKSTPASRRLVIRRLALVGALLALIATTAGSAAGGQHSRVSRSSQTIYLLWPNSVDPGWPEYYEPSVVRGFQKVMPGVKLVQLSADNSQSKQLAQVDAAIASKAAGVVLAPAVPPEAGASLKKLAQAHIPVVSYLIDPDGGPAYAYVWVNFTQVGGGWGKYMSQHLINGAKAPVDLVLANGDPTFVVYQKFETAFKPYLNTWQKSGKVKIACQFDTTNWQPAVAQTAMEQCITKTGGKIDAVLAMNDSISDGVWAALKAHGLAGKVMIYGGYDGALTVVQRVLINNQIGTWHIDGAKAGLDVAKLMKAALAGKSAASTGLITTHFNNHFTAGGVPTDQPNQIFLTRSNITEVIKDHIYTKKEICTSIAKASSFCK